MRERRFCQVVQTSADCAPAYYVKNNGMKHIIHLKSTINQNLGHLDILGDGNIFFYASFCSDRPLRATLFFDVKTAHRAFY